MLSYLYNAHLGGSMEKQYITIDDINLKIQQNKTEFVKECEKQYHDQIFAIVEKLLTDHNKQFILIAGPSSSGKTTTSKILKAKIESSGKKAIALSLDDFFVEREETPKWDDGSYNYETSEAIDWNLFGSCMKGLLNEEPVNLPTYNFVTGGKEFKQTTQINKNTFVIVEGLHALNPIIDKYIPHSKSVKAYIAALSDVMQDDEIYIEHKNVRLFRRIIRDLHTRSTSVEDTLKSWQKVSLGETLYIDPFVDTAEFFVNTFHAYELSVYKTLFEKLKTHTQALETLSLTLEPFENLNDDIVPKDSVLQEFIPHN